MVVLRVLLLSVVAIIHVILVDGVSLVLVRLSWPRLGANK